MDVGEETKIVGDVDVSTAVDECMIVWVLRGDVDYVVVVDATDAWVTGDWSYGREGRALW
jgi:hypothetical protein